MSDRVNLQPAAQQMLLERCKQNVHGVYDNRVAERDVMQLVQLVEQLQDELKSEKLYILRPAAEWHEDFGTVLWHHLPIQEPPYVGSGAGMNETRADGSATVCRYLIESGWLTHWSPLPDCNRLRVEAVKL